MYIIEEYIEVGYGFVLLGIIPKVFASSDLAHANMNGYKKLTGEDNSYYFSNEVVTKVWKIRYLELAN